MQMMMPMSLKLNFKIIIINSEQECTDCRYHYLSQTRTAHLFLRNYLSCFGDLFHARAFVLFIVHVVVITVALTWLCVLYLLRIDCSYK